MKRILAIFVELIPVVSVFLYITLFKMGTESGNAGTLMSGIAFLLAFLGFIFAFIGCKLDGKNKVVRILGRLDKLTTVSIIVFFIGIVFVCGL